MRDLIVPYDPRWAQSFLALRDQLRSVLVDPNTDIQHVGSTAIPGLPAKPILDIDIIIDHESQLPVMETRLLTAGYLARGDQGIPGRWAFRQADETVPRAQARQAWMPHHLYVCLSDSLALKNHLCFRDALLADPALAEAYGKLKQELVHRPGIDREAYTRAKTAFILDVLSGKGFRPDELVQIAEANR